MFTIYVCKGLASLRGLVYVCACVLKYVLMVISCVQDKYLSVDSVCPQLLYMAVVFV